MRTIHRCRACMVYTLRETCPKCGAATGSPHPVRFSPLDPYGKYRRALARAVRDEKSSAEST